MRPATLFRVIAAATVFPLLLRAQNTPPLEEPLAIVQNGRYGYIDHSGTVIIRPQFLWATDFEDGFASVYVCGRLVSMNRSGEIVPLRLAGAHRLEPEYSDKKAGFVDSSGRFVIAAVFDDALPFSDGLAAVRVEKLWGFIDATGRQVIPPTFEAAYYFREGVAHAEKDGDDVLIDKAGKVLARGFAQQDLVTEGRVPVSRSGQSGYLDLRGNIAIPLLYQSIQSFGDGLAAVRKGDKWGYIDRDGQIVIPFTFDRAGTFASGLAPVRIADRNGFIDKSGKFAFELAFDYAPGFLTVGADGLLTAGTNVSRFWTKNGAFGYVNTSGKVIWGPVSESPSHAPLLGWSEKDKVASCEGVPESVRKRIAALPR